MSQNECGSARKAGATRNPLVSSLVRIPKSLGTRAASLAIQLGKAAKPEIANEIVDDELAAFLGFLGDHVMNYFTLALVDLVDKAPEKDLLHTALRFLESFEEQTAEELDYLLS